VSLLVEAFTELPQPKPGDDPDLFRAGLDDALGRFRRAVRERYTEGTLCRILESHLDPTHRRAAAAALALVGTMSSNATVAAALHDADADVRQAAADGIWDLWFRDEGDFARELRQAVGLPDVGERLAACDDLIARRPHFAEAYNQRAIQHFVRNEYTKAIADCEAALRLNPYHFGAASGLGQCYLRMHKPRAAERAFRHALELNPNLTHLHDVLAALRDTLGGE
jgi:tetratricopeptide (TPR) repeat protein